MITTTPEQLETESTREDLARAIQEALRATAAASREAARYAANVDPDTPRALAAMNAANVAENVARVEMWRIFYALP